MRSLNSKPGTNYNTCIILQASQLARAELPLPRCVKNTNANTYTIPVLYIETSNTHISIENVTILAKITCLTLVAMETLTVAMVTNPVTMTSTSYHHTNTSPIIGLSQSELRPIESKTGTGVCTCNLLQP